MAALATPVFAEQPATVGDLAPTAMAKRERLLIRNGAVVTVDEAGTLLRTDVLVEDGIIRKIGKGIDAADAQLIDATDMIVMPGLIDTHFHMWSTLGRSFTDGASYSYYPAKWATASLYTPDDFYVSVMLAHLELLSGGITTVHNWDHNTRSPLHADAQLLAHRHSLMRVRYAYGHIDRLPVDQPNLFEDIPRVRAKWFDAQTQAEGLIRLGVNLRGPLQSNLKVFYEEVERVKKLGLPAAIHAAQDAPNLDDAVEYEKRGILGSDFLIAHYTPGRRQDFEALARAHTSIAFATHSDMRLTETGDARAALLRMRDAGVNVALSSDAASISPPNLFEMMRLTWNMGVPWKGTDTERSKIVVASDVIQMATINGAVALGLDEITGSIKVGKRADIILIRMNDLNMAPVSNVESAIVQGATPANVDTVIVDGRIVKRHGKLILHDQEKTIARANVAAARIRSNLGPEHHYVDSKQARLACCATHV